MFVALFVELSWKIWVSIPAEISPEFVQVQSIIQIDRDSFLRDSVKIAKKMINLKLSLVAPFGDILCFP